MTALASFLRFGISVAAAAAVTLAVFFAMQAMINTGKSAMTDAPEGQVVRFVKVEEQPKAEEKERKPDKPPEPPKEPPKPETPQPSRQNTDMDVGSGMGLAGGNVASNLGVEAGISGGSGDGSYLPIVKVAPTYPQRALRQGIEGYVVVEFTVTKNGSVEDARVIEADPPKIFNRAALQAARKFKYKPKTVNGEPVKVSGVRNIIRFKLDKSSR